MARLTRSAKQHVDSARENVNRLLASPLKAIAEKLGHTLQEAECEYNADSLPLDKLAELCSYVSFITARLPRSFGERFFFDAAMIRAIASDWAGLLTVSPMVIPCYEHTWGHHSFPMPSEDRQHAHLVDLILFPGDDRLEDVNLLAYPWMAHELGHYALFRDDSQLRAMFVPCLDERVRSLRVSAIADRGAARVMAQTTIDDLTRLWTPSADHKNWAHELAIDMIALWTCGPAYLASFQDEIEHPNINPYEVTQDHPPYQVRLRALADGARQLGFENYTEGLERVNDGWAKSRWRRARDNRFLALADRSLIRECLRAAFRFCESLQFVRCTPARLDDLRPRVSDEASESLGVGLLLSAWLVREQRGESAFSAWQERTVYRLAQHVTQLSR